MDSSPTDESLEEGLDLLGLDRWQPLEE